MRRRERNRTRRRVAGEVILRKPGSLKPFKRALALEAQMQAIVDKGLISTDRQLELNALPPYISRGHGNHHVKVRRADSRAMQDRSKYDPRTEDRKHHYEGTGKAIWRTGERERWIEKGYTT